jgi:hypothetical protein
MNAGVCRHCESRSKQLVTVSRTGGGTYRRPSREYRSSICLPCAKRLLERAPTYAMATVECWSVRGLRNAVARAEQEIAAADAAAAKEIEEDA